MNRGYLSLKLDGRLEAIFSCSSAAIALRGLDTTVRLAKITPTRLD